jgi:hypothetical protein
VTVGVAHEAVLLELGLTVEQGGANLPVQQVVKGLPYSVKQLKSQLSPHAAAVYLTSNPTPSQKKEYRTKGEVLSLFSTSKAKLPLIIPLIKN